MKKQGSAVWIYALVAIVLIGGIFYFTRGSGESLPDWLKGLMPVTPPSADDPITGIQLIAGCDPTERMMSTIGLTAQAEGSGPFQDEEVTIKVKHLGSGEVWTMNGKLDAGGVYIWRRQFPLPGYYEIWSEYKALESTKTKLTIQGVVLDIKNQISRSVPGDNHMPIHLYADRVGDYDIVYALNADWTNEVNWFTMDVNQGGYGTRSTWFRPFVGDYWFDARQGSYTALSWGGEEIVRVVP